MANDFSAFNPVVWGLFGGFVILVVAVERVFRARHPDYPGPRRQTDEDKE